MERPAGMAARQMSWLKVYRILGLLDKCDGTQHLYNANTRDWRTASISKVYSLSTAKIHR